MLCLAADYLYSPEGMLSNHVLEVTPAGQILAIRPRQPEDQPHHYSGILCPGFINAHCHLELSMLQGHIPEATGMAGFARHIITRRGQFSEEVQQAAVLRACEEAWEQGTVAIGDICNTSISIPAKRTFSKLYTHSFLELLGLDPQQAPRIVEAGQSLAQEFEGLPHSLTLHAPYSISSQLIQAVWGVARPKPRLSIHLLESQDEIDLFSQASSPLQYLYQELGIPFPGFSATNPFHHLFEADLGNVPLILVHLTQSTPHHLHLLNQFHPHPYFCLCPRSNHYIHRTFPHIPQFLPYTSHICLGTDSLASNHSLSILDEISSIHHRYPEVPVHTLLRWATTQGAAALGVEDRYGAFIPGTSPGVICISEELSTVKRIK